MTLTQEINHACLTRIDAEREALDYPQGFATRGSTHSLRGIQRELDKAFCSSQYQRARWSDGTAGPPFAISASALVPEVGISASADTGAW
jgi:hypothetical protein